MAREIGPETVPTVPEEVVWQELDGKVVALHTGLGKYISLNATGSLLWVAVDGKKTAAELAHRLCETYDVDGDTALQDTLELFRELSERGFLQVSA
jgi:hypothetical protein